MFQFPVIVLSNVIAGMWHKFDAVYSRLDYNKFVERINRDIQRQSLYYSISGNILLLLYYN